MKVFLLLLFLLEITSCIESKKTQLNFIPSQPGRTVSSFINFEGTFNIIKKNCFQCHDGTTASDMTKLDNAKDFVDAGYILPGDPLNSSLYNYLKGSEGLGPKTMPKYANINIDEVVYIKNYILQMQVDTDDETNNSISHGQLPNQFSIIQKILEQKCTYCHNGGVASDFIKFNTSNKWVIDARYVKYGSAETSPLFTRLKGSPGDTSDNNMPIGTTISSPDIDYIKNWINSLSYVEPDPSLDNNSDSILSSIRPRLGDMKFMANFFHEIFGNSEIINQIVNENIIEKQDFFGGGCNIYTTTKSPSDDWEYPLESCHGTSTNVNPNPLSQTLREANRIKACEKASQVNDAISYALNKATDSNLPTFNDSNIDKVYNLFYPLHQPDASIRESFILLTDLKTEEFEKWRLVILALCHSPEWQKL